MSNLPVAEAKTPREMTAVFLDAFRAVDAENPQPEDVQRFSATLEKYPQMWAVLGDFANHAIHDLIKDMRVGVATKESLKRGVKELGKELSRPNDTALERMVIDQVILCWLRLYDTECQHNYAHRGTIQHSTSDFWDRKLNAAQHRYLRAIESLARVRKLARVTIRVQVEQTARRQLEQPYKVIEQT